MCMVRSPIVALTVATAILIPCIANCEDLDLDTVMNPQEQEAAGLNRLTPAERQAFDKWLNTWTRHVIQQAPSYHPSMTLSQWFAGWPGYLKPRPLPKAEATKEKQEVNQTIFRNKGGAVLELNDGSVWNITAIDQPVVQFWARGQHISMKRNPRDIVRPFLLYNNERREEAGGTRGRPPSPEGQRPPDNPAYFRGASTINTVTPDGITITLTTGEVWIVAPTGQQLVQATWQPRDRLRIERSSDAIYRYRLLNLDSGDSVLANPPYRESTPGYYQQ